MSDEFKAQLEAAAAAKADRDRTEEGAQAPAPRERSNAKRGSGAKSRARDESSVFERPELDRWSPANTLVLPDNDALYVYRWIAEFVNGSFMANNLSKAKREGWQFVSIDELPEDFIVDEDMKGDGLARVGGLIMARLPRKFAEQRKAHYARRSQQSLQGANTLQGIAGRDSFVEDRGTRSLDGRAAGEALRSMARS